MFSDWAQNTCSFLCVNNLIKYNAFVSSVLNIVLSALFIIVLLEMGLLLMCDLLSQRNGKMYRC